MKDSIAKKLFDDFCSITQVYLNQTKGYKYEDRLDYLRQMLAGITMFVSHYMVNTGSSDPLVLCDMTCALIKETVDAEIKKRQEETS